MSKDTLNNTIYETTNMRKAKEINLYDAVKQSFQKNLEGLKNVKTRRKTY